MSSARLYAPLQGNSSFLCTRQEDAPTQQWPCHGIGFLEVVLLPCLTDGASPFSSTCEPRCNRLAEHSLRGSSVGSAKVWDMFENVGGSGMHPCGHRSHENWRSLCTTRGRSNSGHDASVQGRCQTALCTCKKVTRQVSGWCVPAPSVEQFRFPRCSSACSSNATLQRRRRTLQPCRDWGKQLI